MACVDASHNGDRYSRHFFHFVALLITPSVAQCFNSVLDIYTSTRRSSGGPKIRVVCWIRKRAAAELSISLGTCSGDTASRIKRCSVPLSSAADCTFVRTLSMHRKDIEPSEGIITPPAEYTEGSLIRHHNFGFSERHCLVECFSLAVTIITFGSPLLYGIVALEPRRRYLFFCPR